MELDSHQVPHFSSISSPCTTQVFVFYLNPSPSGLHTLNQNSLCRLCKRHWEALIGRDKQSQSHHLLGLSCGLWLHLECCALRESSFRPNFWFSLVVILSILWSVRRTPLLFWKATCLAGLLRDSKSWSECVFPKVFYSLYLILVSGVVVALAHKSFFLGLRVLLSLWFSTFKMELAMAHTFEGSLWGWMRVCVQI